MNQAALLPIWWEWTFAGPIRENRVLSVRPSQQADVQDQAQDWADVQAALDGDQQAYRRLVERYQQPIAELLWRFCRQTIIHEELVHDTFVEAYFSLRTYEQKAPLLHWLRRIATRVGYKYWKKREQNRQQHPFSIGSPGELEQVREPPDEAAAAAERLAGLLDQLAPRDRLVLTLLYWEGCSVAEAAGLTGWTEALVKVQAHRARKRLRKLLDEAEQ